MYLSVVVLIANIFFSEVSSVHLILITYNIDIGYREFTAWWYLRTRYPRSPTYTSAVQRQRVFVEG